MAWRIDEQVIRGEIDNRVRGRVVGRLWLTGRAEPLELDLAGDCWRDLAGRRLEFVNPEPKVLEPCGLTTEQKGRAGDITASRKVKVPDIPLDEIGDYYVAKKPFPWHWGNSLYLEWFSESNGRVVVESVSYELNIIGEPGWEMSPEEEAVQRLANEKAMTGFMDTLSEASEVDLSDEEDWDVSPQTEEEADRMLHRNDLLTDRILARMERAGENADLEEIIENELERRVYNAKAGELDWVRCIEDLYDGLDMVIEFDGIDLREHSLVDRARELALQLFEAREENQWVPEGAIEDHPAAYLVESVVKAGAKLSAALVRLDWSPDIDECGMTIAQLKRARVYLDDAITALESCQEQQLIEPAQMAVVMVEVIDIAKEADEMISELRDRLKEGR